MIYTAKQLKQIKINQDNEEYKQILEQVKTKKLLDNQFLVEINVEKELKDLQLKNYTQTKIEKELKDKTHIKLYNYLKENNYNTQKVKVVNGWSDEKTCTCYFVCTIKRY